MSAVCSECGAPIQIDRSAGTPGMPVYVARSGLACTAGGGHIPADPPRCECGHAASGHRREGRGYYVRYGMCLRTAGHAGPRVNVNLCPCMRYERS